MRRTAGIVATSLTLAMSATPVVAQSLADEIAEVQTGVVRFSFETRPEVCGDGRSIAERTEDGFVSYTMWSGGYSIESARFWEPDCRQGPMRIVIERVDGRVDKFRAAVGVEWMSDAGGTDLGTFSGSEAANWLLAVASNDEEVGNVAFLAANAALGAVISDRLMAMIRDRNLHRDTRQRAMRWINRAARREGQAADADQLLRDVALASAEHPDIRERAIRSLRPTEENDSWLRNQYVQLDLVDLRERVLRRIGESPTDRNVAWIRRIALDANETAELRERALRVLGNELERTEELRGLYPQLDRRQLKERVVRIVGEAESPENDWWIRQIARDRAEPQDVRDRALRVIGDRGTAEAAAWLEAVALDDTVPLDLRDRALRLLGEYESTVVRDLFNRLDDPQLQDRALRLVAGRSDKGTVEWLKEVAVGTQYQEALRDRALRSLAESAITTVELATHYDEMNRTDLQRRVIRLLAERDDEMAVAKLRDVAERDPSEDLRRYAMRRLAEMDHPDAAAYLEEAVRRP